MVRKSFSLLTALVAFVLLQTVAHADGAYRLNGAVASDRVYGAGTITGTHQLGAAYITRNGVTYQYTVLSITITGNTAVLIGYGANAISKGSVLNMTVVGGSKPAVVYAISGLQVSSIGAFLGTAAVSSY